MVDTYRISQLAERSGIPASTLRFYGSAGLLPAERSPAGYRLYDDAAVDRLAFIGTAKRLGLPLDAIAELLQVWENGACAQVKTDLRPLLQARLAAAEQRQDETSGFIATVRGAIGHLDGLPDRAGPCDPSCGFLTLAERWRTAPVACSLPPDGVADRAERWRSALSGARREPVSGGVRLTLPIDRLAAVADLAAAEQACCPFVDFRLHLDGPDLHLQVRAPAEGQDLLAGLFGL